MDSIPWVEKYRPTNFNEIILDDIKLSIANKVITGKMGTCDVFSSKAGNTSYCLIGLGSQKDLNIQVYEKCLKNAIKKIKEFKMSSMCVDLTNIKIRTKRN